MKSQLLGQILLAVGFLGAATATVFRVEGDSLTTPAEYAAQLNQPIAIAWESSPGEPPQIKKGILRGITDSAIELEVAATPKTAAQRTAVPVESIAWARTKTSARPWSTIPWAIYAGSLVLGIVGVVVLRRNRAQLAQQVPENQATLADLLQRLQRLTELSGKWQAELGSLTCEKMLALIDAEAVPLMNEFADERQVLKAGLGTDGFASVMTEFASGERYLNRTWAAAADGYVDEVQKSLAIAHDFFKAAAQELNKLSTR